MRQHLDLIDPSGELLLKLGLHATTLGANLVQLLEHLRLADVAFPCPLDCPQFLLGQAIQVGS